MFVAGDFNGHIFTSPDAIAWTDRGRITPNAIFGIAVGNGVFAAADELGFVMRSSDGAHWGAPAPVAPSGSYLSFGDGKFVLPTFNVNNTTGVSINGLIYSSPDGGESWTSAAPPGLGQQSIFSIGFGNGVFCAAATTGGFARSQDGAKSWSAAGVIGPVAPAALNAITAQFAGGLFLVSTGELSGSPSQTGALFTSSDGLHFSPAISLAAMSPGVSPQYSAFGNGVWVVALGQNNGAGTGGGHVYWSSDAITWHEAGDITGAGVSIFALAFDGSVFSIIDANGAGYVSSDGKTWRKIGQITTTLVAAMIGVPVVPTAAHDDGASGYRSIGNTGGIAQARAARLRRDRRSLRIPRR